jgi:hypothetical protein
VDLLGQMVAALAALGGIILGSYLSSRQSSTQALWNLRREAYGAILSKLGAVERVCDSAAEYIDEDEMRYFHCEAYASHNEKISDLMKSVRDRFSDDHLILTEEFIKTFEAFMSAIEPDPNAIPPEEHEQFVEAVKKYRPRLLTIARREVSSGERTAVAKWLCALGLPSLTQGTRRKAKRVSLSTGVAGRADRPQRLSLSHQRAVR